MNPRQMMEYVYRLKPDLGLEQLASLARRHMVHWQGDAPPVEEFLASAGEAAAYDIGRPVNENNEGAEIEEGIRVHAKGGPWYAEPGKIPHPAYFTNYGDPGFDMDAEIPDSGHAEHGQILSDGSYWTYGDWPDYEWEGVLAANGWEPEDDDLMGGERMDLMGREHGWIGIAHNRAGQEGIVLPDGGITPHQIQMLKHYVEGRGMDRARFEKSLFRNSDKPDEPVEPHVRGVVADAVFGSVGTSKEGQVTTEADADYDQSELNRLEQNVQFAADHPKVFSKGYYFPGQIYSYDQMPYDVRRHLPRDWKRGTDITLDGYLRPDVDDSLVAMHQGDGVIHRTPITRDLGKAMDKFPPKMDPELDASRQMREKHNRDHQYPGRLGPLRLGHHYHATDMHPKMLEQLDNPHHYRAGTHWSVVPGKALGNARMGRAWHHPYWVSSRTATPDGRYVDGSDQMIQRRLMNAIKSHDMDRGGESVVLKAARLIVEAYGEPEPIGRHDPIEPASDTKSSAHKVPPEAYENMDKALDGFDLEATDKTGVRYNHNARHWEEALRRHGTVEPHPAKKQWMLSDGMRVGGGEYAADHHESILGHAFDAAGMNMSQFDIESNREEVREILEGHARDDFEAEFGREPEDTQEDEQWIMDWISEYEEGNTMYDHEMSHGGIVNEDIPWHDRAERGEIGLDEAVRLQSAMIRLEPGLIQMGGQKPTIDQIQALKKWAAANDMTREDIIEALANGMPLWAGGHIRRGDALNDAMTKYVESGGKDNSAIVNYFGRNVSGDALKYASDMHNWASRIADSLFEEGYNMGPNRAGGEADLQKIPDAPTAEPLTDDDDITKALHGFDMKGTELSSKAKHWEDAMGRYGGNFEPHHEDMQWVLSDGTRVGPHEEGGDSFSHIAGYAFEDAGMDMDQFGYSDSDREDMEQLLMEHANHEFEKTFGRPTDYENDEDQDWLREWVTQAIWDDQAEYYLTPEQMPHGYVPKDVFHWSEGFNEYDEDFAHPLRNQSAMVMLGPDVIGLGGKPPTGEQIRSIKDWVEKNGIDENEFVRRYKRAHGDDGPRMVVTRTLYDEDYDEEPEKTIEPVLDLLLDAVYGPPPQRHSMLEKLKYMADIDEMRKERGVGRPGK